jgi:hypothetical protein
MEIISVSYKLQRQGSRKWDGVVLGRRTHPLPLRHFATTPEFRVACQSVQPLQDISDGTARRPGPIMFLT